MPRSHSRPRTPLPFRRIAMSVVFALTVFASMQCRMVEDTVTGVDNGVHAGSARPSMCLRGCMEQYRRDLREEHERHRRAVRRCRGDRRCAIAERATHRERIAAIAAMVRDCRRGCYGEGGGAGGR